MTAMKSLCGLTALLFLGLTASCSLADADKREGETFPHPVQWYDGYTLPKLLAESPSIETRSDLTRLLGEKWYSQVEVINPKTNERRTLSSCEDYIEVRDAPIETVREIDGAPFMSFQMMCAATQLIVDAIPSEKSVFSKLKFNHNLPTKMPAEMAMAVSVAESNRIHEDPDIEYWAQVNEITDVTRESEHRATYHHKGGHQTLALVAKGDFNKDGQEDYLISSKDTVEGGSYSALRLFIVTRSPTESDYSLIRQVSR